MATITDLPNELLLIIFEDIKPSLGLMLLNSRFKNFFEPQRYRAIRLEWSLPVKKAAIEWFPKEQTKAEQMGSEQGSDRPNVHLFVRTLLSRPKLAAHVQAVYLHGDFDVLPELLNAFNLFELSQLSTLSGAEELKRGSLAAFFGAALQLSDPQRLLFRAEKAPTFMALPQLLEIYGKSLSLEAFDIQESLNLEGLHIQGSTFKIPLPNLKTLRFTSLKLPRLEIKGTQDLTLLGYSPTITCPNLVKFKYTASDDNPFQRFSVKAFAEALLSCKETLEELEIKVYPAYMGPPRYLSSGTVDRPKMQGLPGSFKEFMRLKSLQTPTSGVLEPLAKNLPPNVERLRFLGDPEAVYRSWSWEKTLGEISNCVQGASRTVLFSFQSDVSSVDEKSEIAPGVRFELVEKGTSKDYLYFHETYRFVSV
jgi:hypothetical protein